MSAFDVLATVASIVVYGVGLPLIIYLILQVVVDTLRGR